MRKKRAWRYYCDFCGKGGCSGGNMSTHEKHCTLNPQRICRMCQVAEIDQQPIGKLIEVYDKGNIKELREATNGCPACILAALRQWKRNIGRPKFGEHSEETWDDWSYKKESFDFWEEINAEQRERSAWAPDLSYSRLSP